MPVLIDVLVGVFLAYYWTGCEMVQFHSRSRPVNQPQYVNGSAIQKIVSGIFWPYVAAINREIIWFLICFFAGAIVFIFAHYLLMPFVTDIPQVECPFLHVVDVLCPEQAACTTFAVVWAPDPGTERDFWSRQLG